MNSCSRHSYGDNKQVSALVAIASGGKDRGPTAHCGPTDQPRPGCWRAYRQLKQPPLLLHLQSMYIWHRPVIPLGPHAAGGPTRHVPIESHNKQVQQQQQQQPSRNQSRCCCWAAGLSPPAVSAAVTTSKTWCLHSSFSHVERPWQGCLCRCSKSCLRAHLSLDQPEVAAVQLVTRAA